MAEYHRRTPAEQAAHRHGNMLASVVVALSLATVRAAGQGCANGVDCDNSHAAFAAAAATHEARCPANFTPPCSLLLQSPLWSS